MVTEAGKRLADRLGRYYPPDDYDSWQDWIAAIEAEAVAPLEAEIARLRKIEEAAREADSILDKHILRLAHYYWPNGSHIQTFATEARDALLAALAGGSDDPR